MSGSVDTWFETFTGKAVTGCVPDAGIVCIEDIAHALANKCRFGGHSLSFYSVAQHSVIVSRIVPDHLALAALLHDAHEAYTGDMPSPIKALFPAYVEYEKQWERAVADAFGVALSHPDIKAADALALCWEARDVMASKGVTWGIYALSKGTIGLPRIVPKPPHAAKVEFMERFNELR